MKEQQNQAANSDSTSTPSNGAAPQAPTNGAPGTTATVETVQSVIIAEFPRIVDAVEREPVKYGDRVESLPVSLTERVSIDAYFFQSPTNFRLKNIKTAIKGLKDSGVKQANGSEIDSVWFNANVRDPFHKVLRFAAKQSLETGKPVSLAFTRRTLKTGMQVVTAKHAFEHEIPGPGTPKAIADAVAQKEAKQSKNRANRQNRKGKGRISPLPNPVIATVPTPTPVEAPVAA